MTKRPTRPAAARRAIVLAKLLVVPALCRDARSFAVLGGDRGGQPEPAGPPEYGHQQRGEREHPGDLHGGMHDGRKLWTSGGQRLVPESGRTSRRPVRYGARPSEEDRN